MYFNSDENNDFIGFKEEGKEYPKDNDKLNINKEEVRMNINREKKLDDKKKLENKEQQSENNFEEKIEIFDRYTNNKSFENKNIEREELQFQLENNKRYINLIIMIYII